MARSGKKWSKLGIDVISKFAQPTEIGQQALDTFSNAFIEAYDFVIEWTALAIFFSGAWFVRA
jgi:hypothetical protein